MRTKAVRLYGKNDLRLDEYELQQTSDDEIIAKVVTDSVCMSTYKAAIQGTDHKRVPHDIAENPIVIGHEFAGEIVEVGAKWKRDFQAGEKFSIQPNINYLNKGYAPGYSFADFGGDATYIRIPSVVMEKGCLLPYAGKSFYKASLAEPMSCIIAAFKASYHTPNGTASHEMGIVDGGNLAILAGAGPMGLGAIDIALHGERKPAKLAVTDIDDTKLARAKSLFSVKIAAEGGVDLRFFNTAQCDGKKELLEFSAGKGFDDVFAFAPVQAVIELADTILGKDGCLNFFAGPTDTKFSAMTNFYNVHYLGTHIVGTSGGDTKDMKDALELIGEGKVNPSVMLTHIGGLSSAAQTTLTLPFIPGGKKMIYTHIDMPLTAIADFRENGASDARFAMLSQIVEVAGGLWCDEAEEYLLNNW
jgi:threonine dehydrogenase-like Zn-dependent dehydrogenase